MDNSAGMRLYLHEKINDIEVEWLETMLDVHNAGILLDSNQVAEFFQDMEVQYTIANIKKEPVHRELTLVYCIDLTESSSDTEEHDVMPSHGASKLAKERKQKQKPKAKPKPRAKRSSNRSSKERPPKTLSAKCQLKKRPPKKADQITLVSIQKKDLSIPV